MFRLWTWGGKKKSSICSIWVASFMEDLSLNSKKVNFQFTTFKYTFPYTWIREHYELWTIPFPFTTESIQTEPLIINLCITMIICSFHVRGITIFFTSFACLPPRLRQQPPNKNHVAFPATSCFSRRFVGFVFRSFRPVTGWAAVIFSWKQILMATDLIMCCVALFKIYNMIMIYHMII